MTDGVTTHDGDTQRVSATPADVERFVERFTAAWRAGAPGFDGFAETTDPDVLLTQPLMPAARGHAGFRAQFETLFGAIPDLRGEVLAWGPTTDGVLIDLELRGTLAGRPVRLVTCDRIVLRDGRLAERHARMDPLPLVGAALRSPRAAIQLLRATRSPGPRAPGTTDRRRAESALTGLAVGRLVLGALSRVAPHATARAFGARDPRSSELAYMTRIFGARAVALGSGYLLSRGAARRTWQRLALGVDVSDTIAGVALLRDGGASRASGLATTALTGTYAAIGVAKLARDVARGG